MAKSKKIPKGNKAYEQGYVSFSPEDLENRAKDDTVNSEAYELLDKAMFTSSHVSVRDKERGEVEIDDIYPITLEEANEMEHLLDQAESVAGNPRDTFFQDRLRELRGIVNWSKKRHWNFSWVIVVGVIVSVFILSECSDHRESKVKEVEKNVSIVENWAEKDTTISIEAFKNSDTYQNIDRFRDPNYYKESMLKRIAANYYGYVRAAKELRAKADTASTAQRKDEFLKWAEERDESAGKSLVEFEQANKLSFKDVKEMALKDVKADAKEAKGSARWIWFWNIFFLILIPVYIFAERPYGYAISRYRTEAKILCGIKKGGLAFAGGLVRLAGSIGFVEIVTKWSDGSTTREDDGTGPLRLGLKLLLLAAAVVVVCAVSCLLMLYSTIMGLTRNYNWKAITAGMKT